ncbi:MAG: hypothetical protein PHV36_08720 [Elusimicrobiales bacterium]|nr:hypothetical protein [Elusimicrobiales bacterium]
MENLRNVIAKAGIVLPEVTLAQEADKNLCGQTCIGCTTGLLGG